MLANLGIALAAAIVVLLVVAALKPARFRVERRATIAAPPERVYPLIADFRKWREWSPWEGLDPELRRTFSGAETGRGAVYAWDGNKQAGAGRMEITDAPAPTRVDIQLDFTRPFEAHNTTEFTLSPRDGSTEVVWAMHGPQPFMLRLISIFMSMEKMVGKDFEKGLAALEVVAEERRPA